MKSYRKILTLHLPARAGFVNLTPEVEAALAESGIQEGLCLVNAMHITASVFINDDEPGLHADYARWLERLAPFNPGADPAQGGYLLISAGSSMQMGLAFAGLMVVGAMAMACYELFSLIEKHTTGWAHRGSQSE